MRWNRPLLVAGLVVLLAFGAFYAWHPGWGIPVAASTTPASKREYAAAFLGLLVIAFFASGLDWAG